MAVAGLGFYSLQPKVLGQSVIVAPPEGYGAASAGVPASSTNQAYSSAASLGAAPTAAAEAPALPGFLEWGPVDVRPHMLYRFVYGDGILAAPGEAAKTVINQIYPGAQFSLGNNWSLDYTPTINIYSSRLFQNTVDEAVALRGSAVYGDWSFNLLQSYSKTTQPEVETGLQTTEDSYLTSVTASWEMNSKLNLQLGVSQSFIDADEFQSLKEWTVPVWLDYRVTPGLSIGLGPTLGYDGLSASPDETFEEGQGRIQWQPNDKLSIQASGGVEIRQLGGGAPELVSPVYGASIVYQMLKHTRLTLNVSRSVTPSFFENTVETSTSLSGSLRQDITKKFSVSVNGSYFDNPYQNTSLQPLTVPFLNNQPNQVVGPTPSSLLETVRSDTEWGIEFHLTWAVTDRGTVDVFYSHTENNTGVSVFAYTSTQVGFSLGYRF